MPNKLTSIQYEEKLKSYVMTCIPNAWTHSNRGGLISVVKDSRMIPLFRGFKDRFQRASAHRSASTLRKG